MAGNLDGKTALVTGGGSGIGRAASLAYAMDGAQVVVADVNVEGGEETVQQIKEAGGDAILVHADVSKIEDTQAMVTQAVEAFGSLDCAFNNAGISGGRERLLTADYREEDWDRVISINLKGVWLCMKAEIPQMLKQGGGAIVNTASIAGLVGLSGTVAYVAAKHGDKSRIHGVRQRRNPGELSLPRLHPYPAGPADIRGQRRDGGARGIPPPDGQTRRAGRDCSGGGVAILGRRRVRHRT